MNIGVNYNEEDSDEDSIHDGIGKKADDESTISDDEEGEQEQEGYQQQTSILYNKKGGGGAGVNSKWGKHGASKKKELPTSSTSKPTTGSKVMMTKVNDVGNTADDDNTCHFGESGNNGENNGFRKEGEGTWFGGKGHGKKSGKDSSKGKSQLKRLPRGTDSKNPI